MKKIDPLHIFLTVVAVTAALIALSATETDHVEQLGRRLEAKQLHIKELHDRVRDMFGHLPEYDQWRRGLDPRQPVARWHVTDEPGDPDR